MLVWLYTRFMQQLLNNVREFCRKRLTHFRACIFGRNILAYLHQLIQCNQIPVIQIGFLLFDQLQLFFGIINQSTYFFLFTLTQSMPEDFIHFPLHRSRSILQHMLKSFIFAMNIGQEMLCPFREVQNSFQVNNFCTGIRNRRKTA